MVRCRCGLGKVFFFVIVAIIFLLFLCYFESESNIPAYYGSNSWVKRNTQLISNTFPLLQQSKINEVEKFLFFIGYPRSGHSIVASCLDAHPDVVVAHEFNLFPMLMHTPKLHAQLLNKTFLYNGLYQNSVRASRNGWRSAKERAKGYTLHLDTAKSWQGKVRTLRIIGDKSGGITSRALRDSPEHFDEVFKELKQTVRVPIKVLHVVRNPYDMVATRISFRLSSRKGRKANFSASNPVTNKKSVTQAIKSLRSEASAVDKFIKTYSSTVLEVHNVEYIYRTRYVLLEICSFLELDCPNEFLKMCEDATLKRPSRTRQIIKWDAKLKNAMIKLTADFPFFQRYSIESD